MTCSLGSEDDVRHLLLLCPSWQNERNEMLNEIENACIMFNSSVS